MPQQSQHKPATDIISENIEDITKAFELQRNILMTAQSTNKTPCKNTQKALDKVNEYYFMIMQFQHPNTSKRQDISTSDAQDIYHHYNSAKNQMTVALVNVYS